MIATFESHWFTCFHLRVFIWFTCFHLVHVFSFESHVRRPVGPVTAPILIRSRQQSRARLRLYPPLVNATSKLQATAIGIGASRFHGAHV